MKVTIGIILYKTKYLDQSLKSLLEQDYAGLEILLRDHEEKVYSAHDFVKKHFPTLKVEKCKNLWHSGGHNAMAQQAVGDIYIGGSNDMIYPKNFVSQVVKHVKRSQSEVFSPLILRWDYPKRLSQTIDSCGINCDKALRFQDTGFNQDSTKFSLPKFCDGPNGALMIFKKSAIAKLTALYKAVLDPNIHYKNDCDLALRMKMAGMRSEVIAGAVVYHDRQAVEFKVKSKALICNSFVGEKKLLIKNWRWSFRYFNPLYVLAYQFLKTSYLLIRYPYLWLEIKKI